MADELPVGLQVAGVSLEAFGSILTSGEEARGLKFNATEVLREGKLAAIRMREEGERVQSAQRVGFAKSGVELSGSPIEILAHTANLAESNALEITRSAARQAKEMRRAARRTERAGIGSFIGGVIGGVAGIAGGPAGIALGAQIGSGLGSSVGGST